jgi:hypothetical protein
MARRVLSREVVKVPRAIARRTRTQLARCQHALRPARSPQEVLRRALSPGVGLNSFRGDRACRFFFTRAEAQAVISQLEISSPGWRDRTISAADRICAHELRLLGSDSMSLGERLPWHEDVINDFRWDPKAFYRQVVVPYDRADMKVPWELSRCQHLATVGFAYRVTREERYASEVVAQIDDFIARNPPGYGINWVSTMDVAIRVANWLWAFELVADSDAVTNDFLTRLLASFVAHAQHIEENLSVYEGGITTNHTIADYAGLLYLGLMLPEMRAASRWADAGLAGVSSCMQTHTSVDGVDYENSIAYHRLVTEMYLSALVLAERNGRAFPAEFRESLERMVEFTLNYLTPNGQAPLVGDSDDGRWQLLADYFRWDPRDHRHLLGPAAAVFDRADFAGAAHASPAAVEEAAWLVGPAAANAVARPQEPPLVLSSRAFPAGGRYVMRHGVHHAIVSTDEVGTLGFGNHKHNDILSYELVVSGRSLVVDPGSYLYLSDRAARASFRATRAHNTLVVDGREQNEMTDPFRMEARARVEVHRWESDADFDFLDATHNGYEPARHRRRVGFRKDPFAWLVVDTIEDTNEHEAESFIHLAPGIAVAPGAGAAGERAQAVETAIQAIAERLSVEQALEPRLGATLLCNTTVYSRVLVVPVNCGAVALESGWVAPRYGRRVSAPVIRLRRRIGPEQPIGYLILEA